MSSASLLLLELQQLGIRVGVDGENLTLNAPKGVLTSELRERIAACKLELLPLARETADGALQRAPRATVMPLTRAQQRLWFMRQLAPDSGAYNVARAFWWNGDLDVVALQNALRRVVVRHESLRTRFFEVQGTPRCSIDGADACQRLVVTCESMPAAATEEDALARITELASKPMDLSASPLLRAMVCKLGPARSLVCLVVDHIVADGMSVVILVRELAEFYLDERGAAPARSPELDFQYVDFAEGQQRRLDTGKLVAEEAYWRRQLDELPALLEMPTDRPRPSIRTGAGAQLASWIEASTVEALRAFARAHGVTPFMLLLSVLQSLLSRHAGTEDVAVGTVIATRDRPEAIPVIGLFTNNLVLRGDLSGRPSLRELLRRNLKVATEAYAHQQMPFDALVELLAPQRQLGASPLFQVLLVLHGEMQTRLRLGEAELEAAELSLPTARYDLAFDVFEVSGRYRLYCEYSTELFDRETVELLTRRFDRLLAAALESPDVALDALPMIDHAELHRLQVEFNDTAAVVPDCRFIELFDRQVAQQPDAKALSAGDRSLTYAELDRAVSTLAARLLERGAGPGRFVAVHLDRTLMLPVTLLAIHRTGAAHVPLDPGFPVDRIVHMLDDSGAALLVADAGKRSPTRPGVEILEVGGVPETWEAVPVEKRAWPRAGAEDPAYLIYTSGSTGKPKGVCVPQRALTNFLAAMQVQPGMSREDVLAAVTTISFDISLLELFLPLSVGARVELLRRESVVDGNRLAAALESSGATLMQATPATWRLLLAADWRPPTGFRCLCGGEALPQDLAAALLERGAELWNLYGPTETTVWSTAERVDRVVGGISIGRPIANTQVHVLDANCEPVPIGVAGELWIGGQGVALGYHRRPELTAERFRADVASLPVAGTIYRTGDLARWANDGRLYHLGRADSQIKLRGYRIEPGEIEAQLLSAGGVRQAVVVTRSAAPNDERLVAYVVFADGEELTASEMRKALRGTLPDYMIPSLLVPLERLPLTPNGKIDRGALPNPFAAASRAANVDDPPAPGPEQWLAEIWSEVLQGRKVNANDNFFDLGGHSLLTLRVAALFAERTGWQMDARSLFFQSLRQIAATAVKEGGVR